VGGESPEFGVWVHHIWGIPWCRVVWFEAHFSFPFWGRFPLGNLLLTPGVWGKPLFCGGEGPTPNFVFSAHRVRHWFIRARWGILLGSRLYRENSGGAPFIKTGKNPQFLLVFYRAWEKPPPYVGVVGEQQRSMGFPRGKGVFYYERGRHL